VCDTPVQANAAVKLRAKEIEGKQSVLVESQTVLTMAAVFVMVSVLVIVTLVPQFLFFQMTLIDIRPLSKFECWARGCVSFAEQKIK
jgi:hypothetical protein